MMRTWKDMMMMMSFTSIKKKMKDTKVYVSLYSNVVGLTELATRDVELMEDKPDPSKKRLRKSKWLVEKQERREW
jgi:hypothetical protein